MIRTVPPGRSWFTMSLAARLPLLAGMSVIIACVVTSALGLHFMQRELRHQAQSLAETYLDSLSSASVQAIRHEDFGLLQRALETALGFQTGVVDRVIAVGYPDGKVIARAGAMDVDPPMSRGLLGTEWEPSSDGASAWAQREVILDGEVVALAAVQLAFPNLIERRQALFVRMIFASLAVTVISVGLAISVVRRSMASVLNVTRTLEGMAPGRDAGLKPLSGEQRLTEALERLLAGLREREDLAARLAERERVAVLGRLAATVAHEVRNPLAGMLTSIDTIRHYGGDASVRQKAVNLLERGLQQIETVVRTTLATHREELTARPMTAEDMDDLRHLVAPEARRREVTLEWRSTFKVPLAVNAVRLRQVLLNIMLNAIAATPPGGRVALQAAFQQDILVITVDDEGGGLPGHVLQRLKGEVVPSVGDGIGLEVAMRMTALLQGKSIAEQQPHGSRIILSVPTISCLQADR